MSIKANLFYAILLLLGVFRSIDCARKITSSESLDWFWKCTELRKSSYLPLAADQREQCTRAVLRILLPSESRTCLRWYLVDLFAEGQRKTGERETNETSLNEINQIGFHQAHSRGMLSTTAVFPGCRVEIRNVTEMNWLVFLTLRSIRSSIYRFQWKFYQCVLLGFIKVITNILPSTLKHRHLWWVKCGDILVNGYLLSYIHVILPVSLCFHAADYNGFSIVFSWILHSRCTTRLGMWLLQVEKTFKWSALKLLIPNDLQQLWASH